jgi:hypothetical protein
MEGIKDIGHLDSPSLNAVRTKNASNQRKKAMNNAPSEGK